MPRLLREVQAFRRFSNGVATTSSCRSADSLAWTSGRRRPGLEVALGELQGRCRGTSSRRLVGSARGQRPRHLQLEDAQSRSRRARSPCSCRPAAPRPRQSASGRRSASQAAAALRRPVGRNHRSPPCARPPLSSPSPVVPFIVVPHGIVFVGVGNSPGCRPGVSPILTDAIRRPTQRDPGVFSTRQRSRIFFAFLSIRLVAVRRKGSREKVSTDVSTQFPSEGGTRMVRRSLVCGLALTLLLRACEKYPPCYIIRGNFPAALARDSP